MSAYHLYHIRETHTGAGEQVKEAPQASPPYQLAGLALSLHRAGLVTNPRAATVQTRVKNIRQPRSRTAPLISASMWALPPFTATNY